MAVQFSDDDDEVISQLNIVPFVDIVLVLLIIFMVTSTAIVKASLRVDLPQAASGGSSVDSTLNLVLTQDRELFLNGEPSTRDGIVAYIRATLKDVPKLQAVISADKRVPYGEVVTLIDLIKLNGVNAFALNIEQTAAEMERDASPDQ